MSQERRGAAVELLVEMFRRECHPDDLPSNLTEEQLFAEFDTWLQQQSDNETVQELQREMAEDYCKEKLEEALSSPEAQAKGIVSVMRPEADGSMTQLWGKRDPTGTPPPPNQNDPGQN
jgi:hypothetical protein